MKKIPTRGQEGHQKLVATSLTSQQYEPPVLRLEKLRVFTATICQRSQVIELCRHQPSNLYHTQVQPNLAYGLLLINLAVYGAGIALALTRGNDYSNDWFLSLAKMNEKVADGEFYR